MPLSSLGRSIVIAAILAVPLTAAAAAGQIQERRDPALVQAAPRGQAPGAPQAAALKEHPKLPEEDVSVTSHAITARRQAPPLHRRRRNAPPQGR